ncbi:helix-turn-helix domain-containing protein [Lachnoanaerobaculum umeaense]|jgi:hypothetical protein|uniref:AraC family transcriptional regulator n=1 Tax=Lachnoanaerobaculum umeaense TaxID=617123 RepID=A0A385Q0E9_9FIRM|nr:AraC family transcriptional regulator [Lachnoanaerobaculum umeaense]AYA99675.1 AraC family transcriptional regulator [Lachnoanaerobaculum umeaense]PZW98700.1 AraC family transcriptional regulator [Lachnoanaerobaculum umeaense]
MDLEINKNAKTEYEIIRHTKTNSLAMLLIEILSRSVHCHSDLEIGMLLDGNIDLVIDNEVFRLKKNDIYIVNRYQPHSFYSNKSHNKIVIFLINHALYKNIGPDIIYKKNHIVFNKEYNNLYKTVFECAMCYASDLPFTEMGAGAKALDLIYQLSKIANPIIDELSTKQSRSKAKHLQRITDYISEHHSENISLSDIAQLESLSTYYISHFIKKMTGMNFTTYLNNIRFDHAFSLLTKTNLRISDICCESGFSDSRYLNRLFKEKMGMDIQSYRKNMDKIELPLTDQPYMTVQNHISQSKFMSVLERYYTESLEE